jgi:DNA-3-methyladenine glycosylase II
LHPDFPTFSRQNYRFLCDELAAKDKDLQLIITRYGYPPFWSRTPSFTSLIHFILEQQVSLASARAALLKLQKHIGSITPKKVLALTDEELRACYFSRQKTVYARAVARAVISRELVPGNLQNMTDDAIRVELTKIKGIGNWTVDVFLMMSLHRNDHFAWGDIALVNSIKWVKGLPPHTSKEDLIKVANTWKPFRTLAAYLLWHCYLQRRKSKEVGGNVL